MSRSVLKIGGSVLTQKNDPRLRIRRKLLAQIARQVADTPPERRPVALVHGAGSFGHQIVARTRIHEEVSTPAHRLAWAKTQILQNELDTEVCRAFLEVSIPAVPYQPSSSAWTDRGALLDIQLEPARMYVREGLMPVLYGVPVADEQGGCKILSGDVLAVWLARGLGASLIFHGTDVDGVYSADPKSSTDARVLPVIDGKSWEEAKRGISGSRSTDVTGGMGGKVAQLIELARAGVVSRIFNATAEGAVRRVLCGEALGTEVRW
jgi:isopentenyl phosphate kinase